jgi:hypothetical protein
MAKGTESADMKTLKVLALMLAASCAVNVAFAVGIIAHAGGMSVPQALLTAGGAAGTVLTIYFLAVAAYRCP